LLGTVASVLVSIGEMAGKVNRIEETNLERSVESAVATSQRRRRETNEDYAFWDDAVRRLYGRPDPTFIEENFIPRPGQASSSTWPVLRCDVIAWFRCSGICVCFRRSMRVAARPKMV
jgi:hypothetical protein